MNVCAICKKPSQITFEMKTKKNGDLGTLYLCLKHENMRIKHFKRFKKLLNRKLL